MELGEFFGLNEGKEDIKYRAEAQRSFRLLVRSVSIDPSASRRGSDRQYYVEYNLEETIGRPLTLRLSLYLDRPPHYGHFVPLIGGKGRIEISFDGREVNEVHLKDVAERLFIKNFQRTLEKHEETFIHEYIHFMDSLRYKGDINKIYHGASSTDIRGYYNSPVETNAYIQQALSSVENDIKDSYGMSFTWEQFMNILKRKLDPWFVKKMNDSVRKSLLKRAHQLYSELQKGRR